MSTWLDDAEKRQVDYDTVVFRLAHDPFGESVSDEEMRDFDAIAAERQQYDLPHALKLLRRLEAADRTRRAGVGDDVAHEFIMAVIAIVAGLGK